MIISHKYRFIFVKTHKTAGTSIEVFLSIRCGDDDVVTPIMPHVDPHRPRNHRGLFNPFPEMAYGSKRKALGDFRARRRYYNHIRAYILRARMPRALWDSYFKFCVERNPWDKSLSHYHFINARRGSRPHRGERRFGFTFDEYLARADLCHNLPSYQAPENPGNLLVDRVLRYESLMDELTDVFGTLRVPFDGSLHVNAKSNYRRDRRPYHEVYTDEQREIVARAFADEIALHGYEF